MSETDKHLEKAERFMQKGKSEDALREYLEVLEENPKHEMAAQVAAELYLSLGHDRQAANLLFGIFDRQAAQGQRTPAIITYRKLLKIATLTPERSLQAARFLESGNRRESLDAYHSALQGFTNLGRTADALAAMRGIVAQDATVENLRQLGELAVAEGKAQEASAAFLRAGDLCAKNQNSEELSLELYGRAYTAYPKEGAAAIAYARTLLQKETPERAATASRVIQPFAQGPEATPESSALYGRALLATGFSREAAPFLWQLYLQDPGQADYVVRTIDAMVAHQQIPDAVQLARRLTQHQQRAGRLPDHAAAMSSLAEKYPASTEFLEYLLELFNLANREADYCQTLLRLFELYYAAENFLKASDCLDRAAEVDPYVPGHNERLQLLHGKVDESRLRNIATRLQGALTAPAKPEAAAEEAPPSEVKTQSAEEPTVLEDLILQAEIFLQYAMRSRALEQVERIRALFPGEELKNDRLRELFSGLGMFVPAAPVPSAAAGVSTNEAAADDIARVTGIMRNINRQGSVKAVLLAAVNEIGCHWRASRCVAVLCKPGKPPTLALEYCGADVERFNVHAIVKLVGILQPLLIAHGPLTVQEGMNLPSLAPLKQFAAGMGINSLLTVPLIEGKEHMGLVLLAQCGAERKWLCSDTEVLKNIADQIVQALSKARLRGQVENLAIKEEESGMGKRPS